MLLWPTTAVCIFFSFWGRVISWAYSLYQCWGPVAVSITTIVCSKLLLANQEYPLTKNADFWTRLYPCFKFLENFVCARDCSPTHSFDTKTKQSMWRFGGFTIHKKARTLFLSGADLVLITLKSVPNIVEDGPRSWKCQLINQKLCPKVISMPDVCYGQIS